MQPEIISKGELTILGLTGDSRKTRKLWEDFDRKVDKKPFPKADEHAYEVRCYDSEKPAPRGSDIHVGFAVESAENPGGFTAFILPASEYASFDVCVAKGYDSGNTEMDRWLADNAAQYSARELDGVGYVVECYNEKFKGGSHPDSIVEIWVPLRKEPAS